jgi:hypothetical protein
MRKLLLVLVFCFVSIEAFAQSQYYCEFTQNSCQSSYGRYTRALPYHVNILREALRECKRIEHTEGRRFCRVISRNGPGPQGQYYCQLAQYSCSSGSRYSIALPYAQDLYQAQNECRDHAYRRRDVYCQVYYQ